MTLIGACHICGRPATHTCPLCGQLVCPFDSDPITHICRAHGQMRTGRKITIKKAN